MVEPMSQFIFDFQRSDPGLVRRLSDIPTSTISDALGRKGAMDGGIQAVGPSMKLAGPALTVKAYTADNLMCHLALRYARPGDILVVDAGGYLGAALWGELMCLNAKARGLGGFVIDGAVRDRMAIAEIGFPVFSRGCVPAGTFKASLGDLGVPIACGGIGVSSGDIVIGDADGIVVVPRLSAESVLEQAKAILLREEAIRAQIAEGGLLFDLLNLGVFFEDRLPADSDA
jgi:4-hydroxy-4-methyl-2-oxoglutarate aldolase